MFKKIAILLIPLITNAAFAMEHAQNQKKVNADLFFNKPVPVSLTAQALVNVIKNKIGLSLLPEDLKEKAKVIKIANKSHRQHNEEIVLQMASSDLSILESLFLFLDSYEQKRNFARKLLLKAIYDNNIEVIKFFADRGATIAKDLFAFYQERKSMFDSLGHFMISPLHEAARLGQHKKVKTLLSETDGIDAMNSNGYSALCCAVYKLGNAKTVQLLLDHGANVNFKNWYDGTTPIYNAVQNGSFKVIKKLLKHGANPNIKEKGDKPIISLAAKRWGLASPIVNLLLQHGPDDLRPAQKRPLLRQVVVDLLHNLSKEIIDRSLDFEHQANPRANSNSPDENTKNSSGSDSEDSDTESANLQDLINLLANFNHPLTKALEPFAT